MGKVKEIFQPTSKPLFRDQIVTTSDLEEFKNDLLVSIRQLLGEYRAASGKRWLKSYEVKKLLGISTGTLQQLRANKILPYSKIGGIIYYDLNEINKVLAGTERKSIKVSLSPLRSIKS